MKKKVFLSVIHSLIEVSIPEATIPATPLFTLPILPDLLKISLNKHFPAPYRVTGMTNTLLS